MDLYLQRTGRPVDGQSRTRHLYIIGTGSEGPRAPGRGTYLGAQTTAGQSDADPPVGCTLNRATGGSGQVHLAATGKTHTQRRIGRGGQHGALAAGLGHLPDPKLHSIVRSWQSNDDHQSSRS